MSRFPFVLVFLAACDVGVGGADGDVDTGVGSCAPVAVVDHAVIGCEGRALVEGWHVRVFPDGVVVWVDGPESLLDHVITGACVVDPVDPET